jgi:hypothetical protein
VQRSVSNPLPRSSCGAPDGDTADVVLLTNMVEVYIVHVRRPYRLILVVCSQKSPYSSSQLLIRKPEV